MYIANTSSPMGATQSRHVYFIFIKSDNVTHEILYEFHKKNRTVFVYMSLNKDIIEMEMNINIINSASKKVSICPAFKFPDIRHRYIEVKIDRPFHNSLISLYIYEAALEMWNDRDDLHLSMTFSHDIDWTNSLVWANDLSMGFPRHTALYHQEYQCNICLLNEITVITAAQCVATTLETILPSYYLVVILKKQNLYLRVPENLESTMINIIVHKLDDRNTFKIINSILLTKIITFSSNTRLFQESTLIGVLPVWSKIERNKPFDYIMHNNSDLFAKCQNCTSLKADNVSNEFIVKDNRPRYFHGIVSYVVSLRETNKYDSI